MKKTTMAAAVLGLGALLASCSPTGTLVDDSGYYGNYNNNSGVRLTSISNYTTNYQLSNDVYDTKTGKKFLAGTSIICDNWSTDISFNVNWSGYLRSVGFQFKGVTTGQFVDTDEYFVNNPQAGTAYAAFTLESRIAPLSINSQSIIPVQNVTVLGYTYVRAQGSDANGYASNIKDSYEAIPVMTCYSS